MKKFNLLIQILLFFIIYNTYSQTWEIINYNYWVSYNCIDACDSLHYVISGRFNSFHNKIPKDSTFILITNNGGKTWKSIWQSVMKIPIVPNALSINQLTMLTPKIIIACVEGGWIIRTSDGGINWDTTIVDGKRLSSTLSFQNKKYGATYFGDSKYFYISDDSGKTWQPIMKPIHLEYGSRDYYINDINRLDDSTIILSNINYSNYKHWIIKTTDKGNHWKFYKDLDDSIYIEYISFIDKDVGWEGGVHKTFLSYETAFIKKTTNGGINWETIYENENLHIGFSKIIILDNKNLVALEAKTLIKSTDGGKTWSEEPLQKDSMNIAYQDIAYGTKYTGLMIARHHYILSNYILTNISEKSDIRNFELFIYPNPFKDNILNLKIYVENNSKIKIDLINSLGIIVGKTYSDYFDAGSHTLQYSPDINLSSGTYWLRMTINNKERIVKPVVIVR